MAGKQPPNNAKCSSATRRLLRPANRVIRTIGSDEVVHDATSIDGGVLEYLLDPRAFVPIILLPKARSTVELASGPLRHASRGPGLATGALHSRLPIIRYVQWAKITHHTNNPRYSWMDCGVPTSIRGQLPSVELRSEPFSKATHCQRAPRGRTESGFAKTCGR